MELDLPKGVSREDIKHLIRDKYEGDTSADISEDVARLASGEPLAYVIGWMPFLRLRIQLDSRPLIPRPETEWWAGELIEHLKDRFGGQPFRLLDLCAGSGAIGLAVLKAFPNARVSFGELMPEHLETVRTNITRNGLDGTHVDVRESNLFETFYTESSIHSVPIKFDIVVSNPPYVPESRTLEKSVADYEPREALYAGSDGLSLITRIAEEAPKHLYPKGELWMECDTSNAETAKQLLTSHYAERTEIRTDQYGRPRLVVGYYS